MKLRLLVAVAVGVYFTWPRAPQSPCAQTYRNLFGQGRDITITVVFGYKDARPARFVGDRYERALLIQELTKLGFARSPDDDDLLTRDIRDVDGRTRRLRLRVVNSAAGPDDRENRLDPYQARRTADAIAAFTAEADVVIYNGHARVGGGPDFGPPKLTRDDHVDYAWYKKNQPGLATLASSAKSKLLGVFACDANAHFASLLGQRPAIVSEDLIYFADALRVSFETIQNLVALKCEPDFSPAGTRTTRFFSSRSN